MFAIKASFYTVTERKCLSVLNELQFDAKQLRQHDGDMLEVNLDSYLKLAHKI